MNLIFLRYSKDYYIVQGELPFLIDQVLSYFDIKYIDKKVLLKDADIVTKLILFKESKKDSFIEFLNTHNINIQYSFIEDVDEYIYYGFYNEEFMLKSLFYVKDNYGNYIYICTKDNMKSMKKILNYTGFEFIKAEIQSVSTVEEKLYLIDLISNTNICLKNGDPKLFINDSGKLDLYKIINRIALYKKG